MDNNDVLLSISFPLLASVGRLSLWFNSAVTSISFPKLASVAKQLQVYKFAKLGSIVFPSLASVGGSVDLYGNALLQSVSFPAAASVSRLQIFNSPSLISVSFPTLKTVKTDLWVIDSSELANMTFPLLSTVGGQLRVEDFNFLMGVSFPVLQSVGGDLDVRAGNLNVALQKIEFASLVNVSGHFNVELINPIAINVSAPLLRNTSGYVFVTRCQVCTFSLLEKPTLPTTSGMCSLGRGNLFPQFQPSVAICQPCNVGFFSNTTGYGRCMPCSQGQTSNAESTSCIPFPIFVPAFGCIRTPLSINVTVTGGRWSSPNSEVAFVDSASPITTFTSTATGVVEIIWTSPSSEIFRSNVTIVGPTVAAIPPVNEKLLCGPSGSVKIGVDLTGDAISGLWNASAGVFSNSKAAFSEFNWSAPGMVLISFHPTSVCTTPATLSLGIESECPPDPLSREAVIGVAVGATLGGLCLIVVGVLVSISLYRAWNRRLVNIRNSDVTMPSTAYYKF